MKKEIGKKIERTRFSVRARSVCFESALTLYSYVLKFIGAFGSQSVTFIIIVTQKQPIMMKKSGFRMNCSGNAFRRMYLTGRVSNRLETTCLA